MIYEFQSDQFELTSFVYFQFLNLISSSFHDFVFYRDVIIMHWPQLLTYVFSPKIIFSNNLTLTFAGPRTVLFLMSYPQGIRHSVYYINFLPPKISRAKTLAPLIFVSFFDIYQFIDGTDLRALSKQHQETSIWKTYTYTRGSNRIWNQLWECARNLKVLFEGDLLRNRCWALSDM